MASPRSVTTNTQSYLPSSILKFLEASQDSQPPSVESHPSRSHPKRRRISAPKPHTAVGEAKPIQFIVLRRTTINVVFPRRSGERESACYQSAKSIRINLERLSAQAFRIHLRHGFINAENLLDTEITATELPLRDVELAMRMDVHWTLRSGQGKLWTDTTLVLHRRNDTDHLAIIIELKWEKTETLLHVPAFQPRVMLKQCLDAYFPDHSDAEDGDYTPQTFYSSAHTPASHDPVASSLKTPDVQVELYPFQKRSVQWLLRREGVQWSGSNLIEFTGEALDAEDLPPSFTQAVDDDGTPFFFSDEMNLVTTDITPYRKNVPRLRGGILAEEMGLGKTLEIISLITLHKFPVSGTEVVVPGDVEVPDDALPIKATLLVAPSSLLSQWVDELQRHSPALKVLHYEGFKSTKSSFEGLRQTFAAQDVVITTYEVLSSEIHFVRNPPERQMRSVPRYERARSPLPKCLWWRVCLDEAQMIQGSVSAAAQVAQMIPRVNAWGISGTPVKRGIADLYGLLIFLRYQPYSTNYNLWTHLFHSPKNFARCFGTLALRHTKASVSHELRLPPQKRFVITMPFTPIEQQHYESQFSTMAAECGMDLNGNPLSDDWVPQYGKMREWLVRLRQSALHPEIGGRNRRALGRDSGPLRTLNEIILAMLENIDQAIRADERSRLVSKLRRGQMLENGPRVKEALVLWSSVVVESGKNCNEIRKSLDQETGPAISKRRDESADSEGEDRPDGEETSNAGNLRHRLRAALEIQHMAVFFQSNGFFQLKNNYEMTKPDSQEFKRLEKQEEEGYARAKELRHDILQDIFNKATRLIKRVASNKFVGIPRICSENSSFQARKGTGHLDRLGTVLDTQADQLLQWRDSAIKLLTKPLVDEDEVEITGDEYEESTKTQEEVMVIVMALRSLVSDRHDLLTGERNLRTAEEIKSALVLANEEKGLYPQKTIELLNIRQNLLPGPDVKSLRAIISEARTESRPETEIHRVQKQVTEQLKIIQALELELELFTSTMNTRLEYYRQLQQVSDTVAPYEGEVNEAILRQKIKEEILLDNAVAAARTKRRYFEHLRSDALNSESHRICVICQEEFQAGVFTKCGHVFCKPDFREWWKAHKNCPTCKARLNAVDVHNIVCKSQVLQGQADSATIDEEPGVDEPRKSAIYSEISPETLMQIKNIDLGKGRGGNSTFTTKVDTLAKHIIWLRETDPGAKSLVYCQYKEFLQVLALAFSKYKIGHDSIDRKGGIDRFKSDPSKEVFLLHARAHASGLNLTNANHVFLCEPLLQTALELQAIARVDRIGQKHATTVWLYLIDGTVEESIYDISLQRRLEHMGKSKKGKSREGSLDPDLSENNIALANSMELQDAGLTNLFTKKECGGEAVPDSELLKCLFGARKRIQAVPDAIGAGDLEIGSSSSPLSEV